MKMRTGLVVGFGLGYYLGSKAGYQRYEQLHTLLGKLVGARAPGGAAAEKVKAAVELGKERARDVMATSHGPRSDGSDA